MDLAILTQSQVNILILAASTEVFHVITINLAKNLFANEIKLIADTLVNIAHPAGHQNLPPKIISLPDFRRQRHSAGDGHTFRRHVAEKFLEGVIIFWKTILLNDEQKVSRCHLS